MASIDNQPSNCSLIPEDDMCRNTLYVVFSRLVKTFVDLQANFTPASTLWDDDKFLEYSRLVLSTGLLHIEYCDAI